MDIKHKNIVLTGATGGIGQALATMFDQEGANLILVARNVSRLSELSQQLSNKSHRQVSADLSTAEGRDDLVAECRQLSTGIDVLINCAGVNDFGLFEEQSQAQIEKLIGINLISPILVCQDLLPFLQHKREARIVNVGSTFGSIGYPGFSTYCASKFGLRGFTESLRRELSDSAVYVSYIAPRATQTSLNSSNIVDMNTTLGNAMDKPSIVAQEVRRLIQKPSQSEKYIGWPEKLFVKVNSLLPKLVDRSLLKQLPIIRRFASA